MVNSSALHIEMATQRKVSQHKPLDMHQHNQSKFLNLGSKHSQLEGEGTVNQTG